MLSLLFRSNFRRKRTSYGSLTILASSDKFLEEPAVFVNWVRPVSNLIDLRSMQAAELTRSIS